jgi:hypothetical protein
MILIASNRTIHSIHGGPAVLSHGAVEPSWD